MVFLPGRPCAHSVQPMHQASSMARKVDNLGAFRRRGFSPQRPGKSAASRTTPPAAGRALVDGGLASRDGLVVAAVRVAAARALRLRQWVVVRPSGHGTAGRSGHRRARPRGFVATWLRGGLGDAPDWQGCFGASHRRRIARMNAHRVDVLASGGRATVMARPARPGASGAPLHARGKPWAAPGLAPSDVVQIRLRRPAGWPVMSCGAPKSRSRPRCR